MANTGFLQATTDRTYHFIEILLSIIMIFHYCETNPSSSGHPRIPNFDMFLQLFDC